TSSPRFLLLLVSLRDRGLSVQHKCIQLGQNWWRRRLRRRCGNSTSASWWNRAGSSHQGNVLLAIQHVGDWRPHTSAQVCLNFKKLLALVGVVRDEASIWNDLKHEIARCRQRATANDTATVTVQVRLIEAVM